MSCTPSPTATLYATHTTFTTSTSFSQSAAGNVQLTTIVLQTCVASGTINGSSIGCTSSAHVTQVNTVGGGGQTAQVPVIVTLPVAETQPTQTLFAPCASAGGSSSTLQTSAPTSTSTPLTTSVLVESTPSPSTFLESSSTTLADGSVIQTVVTVVTTPPPTSVYVPTSLASPTLQSNSSQGPGTNAAPIVGGVVGGFVGLIAVVASLWWLCRRRRSWDDIFEKDNLHNEDAWTPRRERDNRRFDSGAAPKPYQYGLVGQVVPPAAASEALRMSQYSSASGYSGSHSRGTSLSTAPLLQTTYKGSSRPSTAGSALTIQTQPGPGVLRPVDSTGGEPRSLSVASHTSSARPLLDGRPTPASLTARAPNMDELVALEPPNRTGSPVLTTERRVLQIVNDAPSSLTDTAIPAARRTSSRRRPSVIVHTDGGRVSESAVTELDTNPPAYSR